MTLAQIRYLQKRWAREYREIGKVAGRYLEAGYHVRLMHPTRYGPAQILVQGKGHKFVVEVFKGPGNVAKSIVDVLAKKAELLKAKPILVLYGRGVNIDDETRKLAEDNGVKIRWIKSI